MSTSPTIPGSKPVHMYEAEIAKLNAELAGRSAVIDDMRLQLNRTFDDVRASRDKAYDAERQVAQLTDANATIIKEKEELATKLQKVEDIESSLTSQLSTVKAELSKHTSTEEERARSTSGLREENQTLNEKNNRLKETIELLKAEVQEAKTGERQRAEANSGEISILMEKITQMQATNSNLMVENDKMRVEAERFRIELEESDDKKELARLTEECTTLKRDQEDLKQQLAGEKIEKERSLEEVDVLTCNLKRMRAALE
ncbi:hypothetical protein BDF19DRAFT_441501 [Syncephalis fuscata]|nr:hypothetical protein BDF19DRAFT_441501 [Syncephalis fuscata]